MELTTAVVGVDVGGTNTDAVILDLGQTALHSKHEIGATSNKVIGKAKTVTTSDVTTGIKAAIHLALKNSQENVRNLAIAQVNIGTTHFINAVVEEIGLEKVAVIRLCGTSSRKLPPFSDFPERLLPVIKGSIFLVNGGYQYDGKEIAAVQEEEILKCVEILKDRKEKNIVVSGIFSSLNDDQENKAAKIIKSSYPEASLTLSHEIGKVGLLERENAAILNESIKYLCVDTIKGLRSALDDLGLECSMYLTQNDGTLISEDDAAKYPVLTFASGATNSMRGAAFLSGHKDAIVVDVGGTSTDIGLLLNGFPRESSSEIKILDVRANLRMPDIISIGLGGGSYVSYGTPGGVNRIDIGPESAGYKIKSEGRVFANDSENLSTKRVTTTDVAVAAGYANIGNTKNVKHLDGSLIFRATETIKGMISSCVDQVRFNDREVPMILVGGGSIIISRKWRFDGISEILNPKHFEVANAVGAALSQISNSRDEVVNTGKKTDSTSSLGPGGEMPKWTGDVITENGSNQFKVSASVYTTVTVKGSQQRKQVVSTTGTRLNVSSTFTIQPPNIDHTTGEWIFSEYDIECLSIGAGILGCGGGGDPYIGKLLAPRALGDGKKIKVVNPSRYLKNAHPENDLVVLVAYMGAPSVFCEKLVAGNESLGALRCTQDLYTQGNFKDGNLQNMDGVEILQKDGLRYIKDYKRVGPTGTTASMNGKRIVALMSVEIGGLNCIEPLVVGAELGIPILDCDGMGRSFPEIQMFSPFIYGCKPYPSTLADDKGQRTAILYADGPKTLENCFRETVVGMGCSGGVVLSHFNKKEILNSTVMHSISRAWRIGDAVLRARSENRPAVNAVAEIEHGVLLIKGKITDVQRETTGGFNKGKFVLEGIDDFEGKKVEIEFHNEFVIARDVESKQILTCVPDLITVMHVTTAQPITTTDVKFGLRVSVVGMRVSPVMSTQKALQVVGPAAFGYPDVVYKPVGEYIEHEPVAPK